MTFQHILNALDDIMPGVPVDSHVRDQIIDDVISLSPSEGQALLAEIDGTPKGAALNALIWDSTVPYSRKLQVSRRFFPDYDFNKQLLPSIRKGLDLGIARLFSYPYGDFDTELMREVEKVRENLLVSFDALERLLDDGRITEELVLLVVDHLSPHRSQWARVAPQINSQFVQTLEQNEDPRAIADIVGVWHRLFPGEAEVTLRQLATSATAGSRRERAVQALIALGGDEAVFAAALLGKEQNEGNIMNISNSTIGVLNAGEVGYIGTISVSISALSDSGNEDIARGLAELTNAVVGSQEVSTEQRRELLEQIEEIGKQAVLPADERAKPAVIKAILAGITMAISTAGGLAEVWSTWGPNIRNFFGM